MPPPPRKIGLKEGRLTLFYTGGGIYAPPLPHIGNFLRTYLSEEAPSILKIEVLKLRNTCNWFRVQILLYDTYQPAKVGREPIFALFLH